MLNRFLSLIFLLFLSISLMAQKYSTKTISQDIHSVQVLANNNWNSYPILQTDSKDYVHIGFDRVAEHSYARLKYKIVYCNADWTMNAELSDVDFIDGFNDNLIEDYTNSINTTVSYTHYNVRIPNEDVKLKLSGNYALLVYDEDGEEDDILMIACFSILDEKVNVIPEVSSITDVDSNNEHHQVSFDLNYKLNLRDVKNDFKVFVRQNNRLDNERRDLKPNYIMPSKLRYTHNKNLIFEAGNEYHRFDISSSRSNGKNVAHIEYKRPNYHMYIVPNKINHGGTYSYDQDQNGRVIYRSTDSENPDNEGDYFFTHLTLHADRALAKNIYINGAFSNNTFSDNYKMTYNEENNEYFLTLFLKQGIYNYQYLIKDGAQYTPKEVEGNFYETENEYSVYVYYTPIGQKYDALVGFQSIQSRQK